LDSQAVAFLQAMAALAVVAVLAFLVLLIGSRQRQPAPAPRGRAPVTEPPPWGQILAAIVLIALVAAAVVWRFADSGLPAADWRADDRALIFFVVMLALAGGGLAVFAIVALVRASPRRSAATAATPPAAAVGETVAPPSATRLLGLLLLALLLLLLAWTYLSSAQQYAAMASLIYPAVLAVALVLLVDKASRAWNPKGGADGFSEWLFCDALVFLQVLAWLNLREAATAETYAAFFFDLLNLALFFLVFWVVDRKLSRLRFLLVYAYLVLLPLGLLLWRTVQGVAAPAEVGWWETLWPVFFLAVIGLVLELIAAVAWREPARPGIAAAKDAVFFAAYGVLLLVAIPAAPT
jgi:hypothetical protein